MTHIFCQGFFSFEWGAAPNPAATMGKAHFRFLRYAAGARRSAQKFFAQECCRMVKHEISKVEKCSIADEMGVSVGDFLCSINGKEVRDILDYRFHIQEECLVVEIEKADGEIWELDIEKDQDCDLGLEFKQSLMSHKKRCRNKCVFCFVDQQPQGLRPSLYIKDDDPRLSFLIGNYVTLTNLSDQEIKRLAGYHLSPLRISVHAADLDLREKMMGTPAARNLFDALEIFNNAGIEMHFQIVLCKGLNDGAHLDNTIQKLMEIKPGAKSLAIVPAGLTRHRDGLFPLAPFTKEDARELIASFDSRIEKNVFLSDEWYILAGEPLPEYGYYGDFPQLDNGVGVLRLFERGFLRGLNCKCKPRNDRRWLRGKQKRIGIITGTAAGAFMRGIAAQFMEKHPYIKISVREIENNFFGKTVTVSGLLTGQDVIARLKGRHNADILILPENAFRAGVKQKVMLDGTTLKELQKELGVNVVVGSCDGNRFCRQLLKLERAKF